MDPKVSIIVPVYNTEEYLDECLRSLVHQTLDDIEIIIVNDGSTDNSQFIIDMYSKQYPDKITALKKENGGLGSARNFGIENAKSEFIGFVDTDDWVDITMFEKMYNVANSDYDIVICDYYVVHSGHNSNHIGKGFRGPFLDKKNIMINSINPAFACNKLYKKSLFDIIKFPLCWYEDVGTIPVLLSYCKNIGYIDLPLYYYRLRSDSITSSSSDKTLGVIESWNRVIQNVNPQYIQETVFAVCNNISEFIDFKPMYSEKFIEFIRQNKELIQNNIYYVEALKNRQIKDLINMAFIPKKIHYCWFGKSPKSSLVLNCMKTWKEKLADYEIIEWNETNCNINENIFVKQAYESKKWAFVADYFRLKAVYENGGFYFDTDLEVTRDLDKFRYNKAFFAFEMNEWLQTGIFGAVQGTEVIKRLMDKYKNEKFIYFDNTLNLTTIGDRLTGILVNDYELQLNGNPQILRDDIAIYPVNNLLLDMNDGNNYTIHHLEGSWLDTKNHLCWKNVVMKKYFDQKLVNSSLNSDEVDVSIIMLFNKENDLDETIKNILSTKTNLNFEILLKCENLNLLNEKYSNTILNKSNYKGLTLFDSKEDNSAAIRNEFIKTARGKYLIFCNSNIRVQDFWLDYQIFTLRNSNGQLVTGTLTDLLNPSLKIYGMTWTNKLQLKPLINNPINIAEIPFACESVLGIPKDAFEQIHGFDEFFHEYDMAISALCLKAWLYGYKLVINPEIQIKSVITNKSVKEFYDTDYIYYILCLSYLHFSKDRISNIINFLKLNHNFTKAVSKIELNMDLILDQRKIYMNESKYNDDFFFHKFYIPV